MTRIMENKPELRLIDCLEIGTPVFWLRHGWGKVTKTDAPRESHPINAEFRNLEGTKCLGVFTKDGKCEGYDNFPSLFLHEINLTHNFPEPKLIPFDIEKAKSGRPVVTRNGLDARIICFDFKRENYPIVALITNQENEENQFCFTNEGKFLYSSCLDSYDLFLTPIPNE